MAIRLTDLLERIPPETEKVVEQTRQRFNQSVRMILRDETRLHLSKMATGHDGEERESRAVRVFVNPGIPAELEEMSFDENHWLAIELAPLKGLLEFAYETMIELSEPIARLETNPEFEKSFPEAHNTVCSMRDLATDLLSKVGTFDILKKIFAIHEDVLGLYSYRVFSENGTVANDQNPQNVRCDLYWAVIGLVSKVLGVSVEALTVKVLAHELAHAYTHIGMDADGKSWAAHAFSKTERGLKEGLAQYYTVRVLDRLARQLPTAKDAYEKLLPHQASEYHTHVSWLDRYQPEEVRDAMLATRRKGVGTVDGFNAALEEARKRLRREN